MPTTVHVEPNKTPGAWFRRRPGLLALLVGNAIPIAGVLVFDWDLVSVLFLMLLEVCASALGLVRSVILHHRASGDPAHRQEQFTGWLRLCHSRDLLFAEGLAYRTLPYPALFLLLILFVLMNQASGPLVAGIPLAISAIAVGSLAYSETASLRREILAIPFATLRARAVAMVYRTAGVTLLCIAGLVWLWGVGRPLQEAVVLCLIGKAAMEAWHLQ
jgi:hypothetical protein